MLLAGTNMATAQTAADFQPYQPSSLRLPSVPLFVNDPYFSLWSPFDKLNDGTTRHWSDAEKAMDGLLRVDGKAYRFMGRQRTNLLKAIAPMSTGKRLDGEGQLQPSDRYGLDGSRLRRQRMGNGRCRLGHSQRISQLPPQLECAEQRYLHPS